MELTSGLTLIVCGEDEDGLRAKDLALRWHRDGLLQEFAWVTPEDVTHEQFGPPTVMVTVAGRDEPMEMMTYLGLRPRGLIRVVLLHLLVHEDSDPRALVDVCDAVADLVHRAMPRRVQLTNSARGTRLLRINLLVPETDLFPQQLDLILPRWEVNAIVSPEDRPDLDRMNIFVRRTVNLHGHALAAAAGVGGLWANAGVGTFDSYEPDSTTGGEEVVVVRCQARMVVGDERSAELAADCITSVQRSELGASPWVSWGVPAESPAAVVRNNVERLFTHPEWMPHEKEVSPLHKAHRPLGDLIRNWAVFQLTLPLAVLRFVFGIGRSFVERSVTAATVGHEAGEVGRIRPLSPEEVELIAKARLKELSDELAPARLEDEAATWGQTTPSAWRELRELVIGLVDGSRLPDRFTRTTRASALEVLPPSAVVASPHLDADSPETPTSPTESEGRHRRTEEPAPGDADGPHEPGDPGGDSTEAELESKYSLIAQVETRVGEHLARERASAVEARKELHSLSPPDTKRLRKTQGLVKLAWSLTFLTLIVIALLVWADASSDTIEWLRHLPDVDWATVAWYAGLVLVALLAVGTAYFQALVAYEWQVSLRLHRLREASDSYVVARREERRWRVMQAGLRDWAATLAELLHRPWHVPTQPDVPPGMYDDLPASVAVATPIDRDGGSDPRMVARAIEHVCQKGWLKDEFLRVVSASPSNDPSALPHAGDLPADLDLGLRPHGPRRELVEVATSPAVKQAATRHLLSEVAELLREGDVRMPPQTVARIGPYSAGEPVLDREFFTLPTNDVAPFVPELFHPSALLAQHNLPQRSVLCVPSGTPAPRGTQVDVHQCGYSVASRVDVSALISPRHIKLFTKPEQAPIAPATGVDEFN
jgi:hypothetical protein